MVSKFGRSVLLLGALAQFSVLVPTSAGAQHWDDHRDNSRHDHGHRGDWNRHSWDRERRKDAKADGVVAGVVGTAVVAGVIAAIASSGKHKDRDRDHDRGDYCRERYGNYDPQSDGYRASDGQVYPCM